MDRKIAKICNECGRTTMSVDFSMGLLSNPIQHRVECECGYKTNMAIEEIRKYQKCNECPTREYAKNIDMHENPREWSALNMVCGECEVNNGK